ncbi:MAG: hypothetical protein C5B50_16610 [Verrucomicrobia bacterium]|nr:MAG: hypothetical protein C5B50_16610 [Verrucomicrobiota bacterium]
MSFSARTLALTPALCHSEWGADNRMIVRAGENSKFQNSNSKQTSNSKIQLAVSRQELRI